MKGVLAWIKKNLLVVIFSAIIVIVLPVTWFFSSRWNKSIRENREQQVKADFDKLKVKVQYALPSLDPSLPQVELNTEPNIVLTEWFAKERTKIMAQGDGVVKLAEGFNRKDHSPLVEGLLPSGRGPEAQSKAWQLAKLLVGENNEPSAYQKLFDSIRAGSPVSGADLTQILQEARERELAAIVGQASGGRQLTPEEEQKLTRNLLDRRIGEYQRRAKEISVYATPAVLGAAIPTAVPRDPPSIRQAFEWQTDFWLVGDVLEAIKAANTGPDGQSLPVADAVVKRIERMTFGESPFAPAPAEGAAPAEGEEAAAPAEGNPAGEVKPNYGYSISGRWNGRGNQFYDVRPMDLVLVVSAKRLPQLIDSISRSNFMTVTDLDLSEVDLWGDLEQGYFYGEESVVRATIEVETVWLRTWTVPFMPEEVKTALGVPKPAPVEAPAEGEKPTGPG